MVLKFIDKKDVWNSQDLIVYFGLYVNPERDRVKSNQFGRSEPSYPYDKDRVFSLDKPIDDTIFFANEDPNEWRKLCERFDFINDDEIVKENISYIAIAVAKAHNLDGQEMINAIEANNGNFGKVDSVKIESEQEDDKEVQSKKQIEKVFDEPTEKTITTDDMLNSIMSGAMEDENTSKDDKSDIPLNPTPLFENKKKKKG